MTRTNATALLLSAATARLRWKLNVVIAISALNLAIYAYIALTTTFPVTP